MSKERKMVRNAYKCYTCDTIVESINRHHLVYCNCPEDSDTRIFVDGGTVYSRLGYGIKAEFEDFSEWEE